MAHCVGCACRHRGVGEGRGLQGAHPHPPASPEVPLFSHQVQVKSSLSIYFVPEHVTRRDHRSEGDGTRPRMAVLAIWWRRQDQRLSLGQPGASRAQRAGCRPRLGGGALPGEGGPPWREELAGLRLRGAATWSSEGPQKGQREGPGWSYADERAGARGPCD